jgi:hypothetical protein
MREGACTLWAKIDDLCQHIYILYINCLVYASVCRGLEMSRTWRWNILGQVRLISGPRFSHKANVVYVCVFVTDIRGLRPGQWDERALRPSVFLPFFLS